MERLREMRSFASLRMTGASLRMTGASLAVLFCLSFGPARAETKKLVLTGSSTIAPLVLEIGKRFEKLHPDVRVNVQTGGSSRGVADARSGLADIGMASRDLKKSEKDLLAQTIALDGVALILHKDNAVQTLTRQQVIDIFTGKVANWKAVGGKDQEITVVNKAVGRSTLELFLHHYGLKGPQVKADVIIGDNQQGIKTVAGNPSAIGYVSVGTAEYSAKAGVKIKVLPVDKVPASVENIRKGIYPISRPLNLVTKEAPKGLVKAFIDFARSPKVHDIIGNQYFVPVGPSS